VLETGTPGLRWRELETDLFSQRSGSASHLQGWIGLKDLCLKSGTAPAPDPTSSDRGGIQIPRTADDTGARGRGREEQGP